MRNINGAGLLISWALRNKQNYFQQFEQKHPEKHLLHHLAIALRIPHPTMDSIIYEPFILFVESIYKNPLTPEAAFHDFSWCIRHFLNSPHLQL